MSYARLTRRATLGLMAAVALDAANAAGPAGVAAPVVNTPKPAPMDLCPVCGMVVSKYPAWIATILWKDGQAHHFDGAKDMFKFLHALPRYAPGRKPADIAALGVTDFYNLQRVDGRQAWYVTGSDVLGPMGHEFVPLASDDDARDFFKDHRGRKTLRFADVGPTLPEQLDHGRF